MTATIPPTVIARRYRVQQMLGRGAMGTVFRVLDRLTGETVALKLVSADLPVGEASFGGAGDPRVALAHEFQTLATLRHPNIISVLDYGFHLSEERIRQPFFTMDLLEEPETLDRAGSSASTAQKLRLLLQVLQALGYLHRRGIIHRDLKPANVLVADDQVKVVDLGLASLHQESRRGETPAGTLAYIAPEVLVGGLASPQADLYAVGVMAYELFVGQHPFNTLDVTRLIEDVLNTTPDFTALRAHADILPVITRLLAKRPEERYASAFEVLDVLSAILGVPSSSEPAAREGFLQAARFIGRDGELAQLRALLRGAMDGLGNAWLIGGESGVGKTRLLDELRTAALVAGAQVVRGGAVGASGLPYDVWRPVLRMLVLLVGLDEDAQPLHASVLKPIIPDIGALLEIGEVPDAPEIDPNRASERVLLVAKTLLRRLRRAKIPLLIVLEDLQWARRESLDLIVEVSRMTNDLPLLLVASFRNDERPDLPRQLPGMQVMLLDRLTPEQVAELSAAMLGETGRQPEVVNLLQSETEGNVFFVVEVVRALAQSAGGELSQIGAVTLPSSVFAGGMKQIVARRLNRVPPDDHALLKVAAVIGREIDTQLLRTLAPNVDIDRWLLICADAAVLEIADRTGQHDRWRFAHDKLREALLDMIDDAAWNALNRQVAEAIERLGVAGNAAALAYHWEQAGDAHRAALYAAQAGEEALAGGAHREAVTLLEQALAMDEMRTVAPERRASFYYQLGRALYSLSELPQARGALFSGLALLGERIPESPLLLRLALFRELLGQTLHRLLPFIFMRRGAVTDVRRLVLAQLYDALALINLIDGSPLFGGYSNLRALNYAERAGPSPDQARIMASVGAMLGNSFRTRGTALRYLRRARQLAEQTGDLRAQTDVRFIETYYNIGCGVWEQSHTGIVGYEVVLPIYEAMGDGRSADQARVQTGNVLYLVGRFAEALAAYDVVYRSAEARGDRQAMCWALAARSAAELWMGQFEALFTTHSKLQALLNAYGHMFDTVAASTVYAMVALAHVRMIPPDIAAAKTALEEAQALVSSRAESLPYYAIATVAALPEVLSVLWARAGAAEKPYWQKRWRSALNLLRNYSRTFPLGQAAYDSAQATYDTHMGKLNAALRRWERAAARAQKIGLPYYEASALAGLALHLPADDPRKASAAARAKRLFTQIGATWDANRLEDRA